MNEELLKLLGANGNTAVHRATVIRTDNDGTIWVSIPGGAPETPVHGSLVEARPGDTVQVRIENGRAVIEGNATSPAATGRTVSVVRDVAVEAGDTASRALDAASVAEEAAVSAIESASAAATAAESAQGSAEAAAAAAEVADGKAEAAATAAANAQTSANTANTAANSALMQLSNVEDVIGVVNWVTEHGTYSLTSDTSVQPNKAYYTRSVSQPYTYTMVAEPTDAGLPTYYELNIDTALSNYVASHLALTDAGLFVLNDSTSYKVLLSATGMQVQDAGGNAAVTYGASGTSFASDKQFYIGSNDAYILFTPASGSTPAKITIGGANVGIGTNMTLSELISDVATASQDATAALSAAQTASEKVDNLKVGGRNLLRNTAKPTTDDVHLTRAEILEDGIIRITSTSSSAFGKWKSKYLDYADYANDTYTLSCDIRLANVTSSYTDASARLYIAVTPASRERNVISSSYDRYATVLLDDLAAGWKHYTMTADVPTGLTTGQTSALVAGSFLTGVVGTAASMKPIEVKNLKLERGHRATDWTQAPEDTAAAIDEVSRTASEQVATLSDALTEEIAGREEAIGGVASTVSTLAETLEELGSSYNALNEYVEIGNSGLTITAANSPVVARMTSAGLRFLLASLFENEGDAAESIAEISTVNDEGVLKVNVAVVLDELRFGHWMWYERENGNMSLKYTG